MTARVVDAALGALADAAATLADLRGLTLAAEGEGSELAAVLRRGEAADRVWVAFDADACVDGRPAIVGWACAYTPLRDRPPWRKLGVYVAPDRRREGLGDALVAGAVAWARGRGDVALYCAWRDAAGRALYARHGVPHVRDAPPPAGG